MGHYSVVDDILITKCDAWVFMNFRPTQTNKNNLSISHQFRTGRIDVGPIA